MRYEKPGYGDPCTWGPCTGDPDDPRTELEKLEQRLEKLSTNFAQHIRNSILKDDETVIAVADNLIRYLTDVEVVDIIRDVTRGRKEAVFTAVRDLVEEAVESVAESYAIRQMELEK